MYSYMKTLLTTLLLTLFTSLAFGQGTLYYKGTFKVYEFPAELRENQKMLMDLAVRKFKVENCKDYVIEFKFRHSAQEPLVNCLLPTQADRLIKTLETVLALDRPDRKTKYEVSLYGYKIWRDRWNTYIKYASLSYEHVDGKIYSVLNRQKYTPTHPYYRYPKVIIIDRY